MNNIIYKFTTIKNGVLVEKSWQEGPSQAEYYDRVTENYAFSDFDTAADWMKTDVKTNVEAEVKT